MALAQPQWYGTQSGHHVTDQWTHGGEEEGWEYILGTQSEYFLLIDVVFCRGGDGWADVCCHHRPVSSSPGHQWHRGTGGWHQQHNQEEKMIIKIILTISSQPSESKGTSHGLDKSQIFAFKVFVNSFFTFSCEVYPLPLQFAMFSLALPQPRITKKLLFVFQFSEECSLFGDRFPGSKGWFPLNMHFVTQ